MKRIQDRSLMYLLLKKLLVSLFRFYYKRVTILGQENIPEDDVPVIFAPTHQNALMDAMAVHACYPDLIVFMMRGDAFGNPRIAKFLHFIKIMPVYRLREGYETLGKNANYFDWAVDTLKGRKALGIMPEGGQREQRRMRPLLKGLFRIGFQAQEQYKEESGVKIIPIGLDYGDYDHTGKHLIINVGKPLEFAPYYPEYEENPSLAYNYIREDLYGRMRDLIVHIDDEKNYARYYLATLLGVEEKRTARLVKDNDEELFQARKLFASRFPAAGQDLSPNLKPLVEKADKYLEIEPNPDRAFVLSQSIRKREILLAVMYSVIILPSLILNGIPYLFIRRFTRAKFSHNGFTASASFIMGFLLYPVYWLLFFLIYAISFSVFEGLFLFLIIAPILALISIRIKYIYEDLFARICFRCKYRKKSLHVTRYT